MTASEMFSLLLLLACAWLVWDNLRAREAAIAASRGLCKAEGLQLLDDTVAMQSLRPARDSAGRLKLKRIYVFEYSDTGNDRHNGSVTLIGDSVVTFFLGPRPAAEGQTWH
jgi:hypothetical protein